MRLFPLLFFVLVRALPAGEGPADPAFPFWDGREPVAQYALRVNLPPTETLDLGNGVKLELVSWDDAQEFCKRLDAQTKRTIRLPTEAEWEYGCRAGTRTTYYSGDTDKDQDRVAWYNANAKDTTQPVGQKEPNVFGLYDMHGNVWEWCQDLYGDNYYSKCPAEDPQGAEQGAAHVLRGGSCACYPGDCRSTDRGWNNPVYPFSVGLRVVVSASRTP